MIQTRDMLRCGLEKMTQGGGLVRRHKCASGKDCLNGGTFTLMCTDEEYGYRYGSDKLFCSWSCMRALERRQNVEIKAAERAAAILQSDRRMMAE